MLFSEETIQRRFRFQFGTSEILVVVRQPTSGELSDFLKSRFIQHRNKIVSRHQEARMEFVDKILVDIEEATFKNADGEVRPLNRQSELTEADRAKWSRLLGWEIKTWKDFVLPQWRVTIALAYEEATTSGGEDEDGVPLASSPGNI